MHKYRILLVFIVFSAYLNSLSNAFVWDDINNIVNNTALEAPLNLKNIFIDPPGRYYRPVPFLSMYMDHLLWGRRPFGFHLTNIILHTLCVLLFFSLMRAFTGDMKHSFFLSALFAVHPANTEAVSYISGRSDPVCLLFIMLSMLFYMRRRILPAVFFFLPALFSKETALVFPLLALLHDVYFFGRGEGWAEFSLLWRRRRCFWRLRLGARSIIPPGYHMGRCLKRERPFCFIPVLCCFR